MGFVKLFWKKNVQDAYSPKISNLGQIVSEILAQLCSDDSIQILLNLAWFIRLGTRRYENFVVNQKASIFVNYVIKEFSHAFSCKYIELRS